MRPVPRDMVSLAHVAALALLLGCTDDPLTAPMAASPGATQLAGVPAPLLSRGGAAPDTAARYIVVFRDDVPDPAVRARETAAQHGATPFHVYDRAVKGFAAVLPPGTVNALRRDPRVKYVELDQLLVPDDTDYDAGWGLGRIDQEFGWPGDYTFTSNWDGSGVNIYIIDSGVDVNHPDFEGRAQAAWTFNGSYPAGSVVVHQISHFRAA